VSDGRVRGFSFNVRPSPGSLTLADLSLKGEVFLFQLFDLS
jgi:hypothetical protein